MDKIAVYPGSFDPVTNGHVDIIRRASKLFDSIIVAVVDNPNKKPFYTIKERMEMMELSTMTIKNVSIRLKSLIRFV